MKDSVLMFRGQRLTTRDTHLARHAYRMALDDAASGQLIPNPEERFPLPKDTIGQPGDVVSFMPATRTYTEREKVLAERAAFAHGYRNAKNHAPLDFIAESQERAAQFYPLPKVTRPRVVEDSDGACWRWTPARGLEWRTPGLDWHNANASMISETCRRVVADLLANPTEKVEAE